MIPVKVRIGGTDFEVVITDQPLIIGNKTGFSGLISYTDSLIKIDANNSQQAQEKTFWHEVLHGIADHMQLELGEDEEYIIEAFAKGMYALMKDNDIQFPGQERGE